MRKEIWALIAGHACLSFCAACSASGDTGPQLSQAAYAGAVASIASTKGILDAPDSLIADPRFKALSSAGLVNLDVCIEFLGSGRPLEQNLVAIRSMHRLQMDEYVAFLGRIVDLYEASKASADVVAIAVVPGNAFSSVLIDNYRSQRVISVLTRVAALRGIHVRTRKAIDEILSGAALASLESYRSAYGHR